MTEPKPPYFVAFCEISDAAQRVDAETAEHSAGAATIELAKLLTAFEDRIYDEWRANLILLGGALFKLHDIIVPADTGNPTNG